MPAGDLTHEDVTVPVCSRAQGCSCRRPPEPSAPVLDPRQPSALMASTHFTLAELVHTAHRDLENTPGLEAVKRLVVLAHDCLEPLRAEFGPLYVSSGYRSPAVNAAVRGSPRSAHLHGCAADLIPLRSGVTPGDMVRWLRAGAIPFDQAIDECGQGSPWLHVGMAPPWLRAPRRECLVMRHGVFSPFPP